MTEKWSKRKKEQLENLSDCIKIWGQETPMLLVSQTIQIADVVQHNHISPPHPFRIDWEKGQNVFSHMHRLLASHCIARVFHWILFHIWSHHHPSQLHNHNKHSTFLTTCIFWDQWQHQWCTLKIRISRPQTSRKEKIQHKLCFHWIYQSRSKGHNYRSKCDQWQCCKPLLLEESNRILLLTISVQFVNVLKKRTRNLSPLSSNQNSRCEYLGSVYQEDRSPQNCLRTWILGLTQYHMKNVHSLHGQPQLEGDGWPIYKQSASPDSTRTESSANIWLDSWCLRDLWLFPNREALKCIVSNLDNTTPQFTCSDKNFTPLPHWSSNVSPSIGLNGFQGLSIAP